MEKISVIVPIYNAESYLHRCIDSILSQTYNNLEIILINDGSVDSSGEICDNYQELDRRIKVIHLNQNSGQSSARNAGIERATGDYITFIDSDDWIVEDIYEYCIRIIQKEQSDVVDFKIIFDFGGTREPVRNTSSYNTKIIQGKEILRNYLLRGQTEKAPFSPCRKLYKRTLFETIRFPQGRINEDIETNYRVLMNCHRIVVTDKIGYYYFQNSKSTTRNGLKMRDFDLLKACEELKLLSQHENHQNIKYLVQVKYARSYFSLLAKIAFYGIEDKTLDQKEVVKELTKKLRQNCFLLLKSPMPFNRKLMVLAMCININFVSFPLKLYKRLK